MNILFINCNEHTPKNSKLFTPGHKISHLLYLEWEGNLSLPQASLPKKRALSTAQTALKDHLNILQYRRCLRL